VSLVLGIVILGFVVYLGVSRRIAVRYLSFGRQ
jgi:hypothetical protein